MKITGFAVLIFGLLFASCSINKLAVSAVSDALGGGKKGASKGASAVFTGDNDSELVGDALPFALKMYEALLASNPGHQGLAVTTASMFVMYANAFVQGPAFILPSDDYDARIAANARAKNLYLRGAEILDAALEKRFPKWNLNIQYDNNGDVIQKDFLKNAKADDVPLLYWSTAAKLSAWSIDPLDIGLGSELPILKAAALKAYSLDENYNSGTLDELFVLLYASLPGELGGDKALAKKHFDIAMKKSAGTSVGLYVSWAQAVTIPAQDYAAFKDCINKALAINVDDNKSTRLVNILNQRKAKFLLERAPYLFVDTGDDVFFDEW